MFLAGPSDGFIGFRTVGPAGLQEIAIRPGDYLERDLFRAGGGALPDIGATSEFLCIHLRDHFQDALVALGLALRQHA